MSEITFRSVASDTLTNAVMLVACSFGTAFTIDLLRDLAWELHRRSQKRLS